jgi:dTDP-4-dehydrorhamnose 3,5-epimerase
LFGLKAFRDIILTMDNKVNVLPGVSLFMPPTHPDDRGFFKEVVRISEIEKNLGSNFSVKQFNHSRSVKNTLRGIHVAPWNKLIYVPRGKVQSVIVDCRKDSPTFGKYISTILGEDNRSAIFVPNGCGNAYLVLSDEADYMYLTDAEWAPNQEKGIIWNDSQLNVKWELEGKPVLSEKDKGNSSFASIFS